MVISMAAEGEQNDSFYAVLNVARDASDDEIKRRYRSGFLSSSLEQA